jgi:putative transposase
MIDNKRMAVHGYVIMENHLHLMVSGENISKEIGNFKSYTARSIVDLLQLKGSGRLLRQIAILKKGHKTGQQYQVWEEGSHPELIQDEAMFVQKMEYIHCNPVRRGYVKEPGHWRYSSWGDYHGESGMIPVEVIV